MTTKTATCQRCGSMNAVINDSDFYRCLLCGHEHAPVAGGGDRYASYGKGPANYNAPGAERHSNGAGTMARVGMGA
jgi:hypothetical protein